MPLPDGARMVRGSIERSINVDSLQEHHESGCSVTNECWRQPLQSRQQRRRSRSLWATRRPVYPRAR